jgi:signal transduction histidine kinase
MRPRWWRYALQQRLGALAAAALIMWTVVTAVAASVATGRIADAVLEERRTRGEAIAARIEQALQNDLRQLDLVAAASVRPSGHESLAREVRRLRLADSVVRIDRDGKVLWARSVASGGEAAAPVQHFAAPISDGWYVEGSDIVATADGPRTFLVLPARESDPIGGAVAAVVNPETTALRALVASYAMEPYRVELLDAEGREIVASRPLDGANAGSENLLAATVPIPGGRWQVRLAQPRADALAPVLTLRRILVGSTLLLLPFAVLVAVAAAHSIRQPVLGMIAAAERLARGELTRPVPPAGEDEIGRLAIALEQLRTALESDERRALLLKRVISVQEEERRRIARELHDQTTQQLTALVMQLDTPSRSPADAADAMARAGRIARAAIDDLHRLIHDLRPSMLDDLGLLPAIRSYAATHLAPLGIQVHYEFPAALPDLSPGAATVLYRVAQEALTNVARHARAETVLIGCTVTDRRVVLEIEDDGKGFDPAAVARPQESGEGLGLLGMRERLALVGGRLQIESEPGQGTRIVAELPLENAAQGASV